MVNKYNILDNYHLEYQFKMHIALMGIDWEYVYLLTSLFWPIALLFLNFSFVTALFRFL